MSSPSGQKFKIDDVIYWSPPKGDYVTIDVYSGKDAFGENYNNSAEEWCVQIDGELAPFIFMMFETFCGFIKLWSRRYATYYVDLSDYMNEFGYDAVFVDGDSFYFCGNEVENYKADAQELKGESVDFNIQDYGDDCCGWCDLFYINKGKMFTLNEVEEA